MFQNHFSLPARLGSLGFLLSLGLLGIAFVVGLFHQHVSFSWEGILQVYRNNPVQWIILTSPVFLTCVFYFMGKVIHARELKLEQRSVHEKEQYHMLEEFIGQMEEGKLTASLPSTFENRSLTVKLEQFRNKLIANRDEEQRRIWEKEGLAQFAELIRSTQDVDQLADKVIRFLVKYTGCNQGSVFIISDSSGEPTQLEMRACYAYSRKKYLSQTIAVGSGLVGQCYLEKETVILHDVPKDYIRITSGLGEATPGFIAIVPMKTDEGVNGVIELAAFSKLGGYQVAFLEKACEAFASVLHTALTASNVKRLLQESQQQTEELRSQEEEMRQNMEELHSTQEQLAVQLEDNLRVKKDLEAREKVLGHTTILSEADLYGTITFVNSKFCQVSQYTAEELLGKGHNLVRHPDMPKEIFRQMWATIKKGEIFRGIVKNRKKDGSHYWVDATIVPVIENGKIVKYIGARYHLHDEALAQNLFEKQNLRLGLVAEPAFYN